MQILGTMLTQSYCIAHSRLLNQACVSELPKICYAHITHENANQSMYSYHRIILLRNNASSPSREYDNA